MVRWVKSQPASGPTVYSVIRAEQPGLALPGAALPGSNSTIALVLVVTIT
jgi:hypothetical protein